MDAKPAITCSPSDATVDLRPSEPEATDAISPGARRTRLVRVFAASAVMVCAAIVIGTAAVIAALRDRAIAGTERQVADTAFMLAEQIDRSLQAVEQLEKNFIARMRQLNVTSIAA